jgi:hypothetical protein
MMPRLTRRQVLAGVGGGIAALGGASLANNTGACTPTTASRSTRVNVAEDKSNAYVGLEVYRRSRPSASGLDPRVKAVRSANATYTLTVTGYGDDGNFDSETSRDTA